MMKHYGVIPFLGRLARDALVAKTLGMTHLDNRSLYISSKWDIIFIIRDADAFGKDDHRYSSFQANFFVRHARARLDKLHTRNLEQDIKKLPRFALFLDSNTQQTRLLFHYTILRFINTMIPFGYDAADKSNK